MLLLFVGGLVEGKSQGLLLMQYCISGSKPLGECVPQQCWPGLHKAGLLMPHILVARARVRQGSHQHGTSLPLTLLLLLPPLLLPAPAASLLQPL